MAEEIARADDRTLKQIAKSVAEEGITLSYSILSDKKLRPRSIRTQENQQNHNGSREPRKAFFARKQSNPRRLTPLRNRGKLDRQSAQPFWGRLFYETSL